MNGDVGLPRFRIPPRRRAAVTAAVGWLIGYVSVVATGQKFDTKYLDFGWQLVPWDVLSHSPWSSVWYLHIQPPLWNLLLGVSAWASPFGDGSTLQVVMASFGLIAAACAATLGERLGLRPWTAVCVALAATLHPETLKGAFEPTYELPVAALLISILCVMADDVRDGEEGHLRRRLVLLAVLVTAVALTRSLYHPLWALAVIGVALLFARHHLSRRTLVVTLAVPLLVMGGWILKNQVLFGQANLSSWFGMNLQRAVIPVLDLEDLRSMRDRDRVSEIAMIGPFGKYELYENAVAPCDPTHRHRALSEATRTTDQWSPNFNFECYLPIFEQAGRDAWAVIREHPEVWLEGRLWSLRSTAAVAVTPAESASVVMRSLDTVYSWIRLDYPGVLSTRGWGTPIYGQLTAKVDFGLVLVPLYTVVAMGALVPVVQRMRRRTVTAHAPVLIAASSTVVFTIVVGAIAELGEQARFRTMTDPLVSVVAASLIASLRGRMRCRREDRRSSPVS